MSYRDLRRQIKVILLGDSGAGKTTLAYYLIHKKSIDTLDSTIGVAYSTTTVDLGGGNIAQVALWDSAGQEKYRSLGPIYYRDANAAIIVYDLYVFLFLFYFILFYFILFY